MDSDSYFYNNICDVQFSNYSVIITSVNYY